MNKLRVELVNTMEVKDIKRSEVAKQVGVSSSRITDFLNDGQELSFDIVVSLVRLIKPQREMELMSNYSLEVTKPKNIRYALEYCSTHRLLDSMSDLLNKAYNHNNKTLTNYAEIYGLVYDWQTNNYESDLDLYKEIRLLSTCDKNLKALHTLLECNVLHSIKEYKLIISLSSIAEKHISAMEDDYLKRSFVVRINQLLGLIDLKVNNDTKSSRERSNNILEADMGSTYSGFAYYLRGMSYFYDDFEAAVKYFSLGISEYKKGDSFAGVNAIKEKMSLLYFVWGKANENCSTKLSSLCNLILDNSNDSLRVFEECEEYFKQSPEGVYLKGLIMNDKELLYQSLSLFLKKGDNLMSRIPYMSLVDSGNEDQVTSYIKEFALTA